MAKKLQEFNLIDAWRVDNPQKMDFTYYSHRHNTYSRIDFILAALNSAQNIVKAKIRSFFSMVRYEYREQSTTYS